MFVPIKSFTNVNRVVSPPVPPSLVQPGPLPLRRSHYRCLVSTHDYRPWNALSVADVQIVFANAPFRWWISGGRALEIFVGRSWRAQGDTDVGVRRRDVPQLRTVTASWDVHVAAAGLLSPWRGEDLHSEQHENNLWFRKDPLQPWCLDVTVGEGDDEQWIYRRDPQITAKWTSAVLYSTEGVPYLAPEIQLLFKSKDIRDRDEADAREVIPLLDARRRAWLFGLLPPEHSWRRIR
jgi:hypothetical protein